MPNNGDISLGDVDADGQVDLTDAWLIAAYLNDPSDPALPAGIGEPVGPAASLSPDPSTVTFADDGAWHRFTVEAGEPVEVVATRRGPLPGWRSPPAAAASNFCPAEADDDVSRQDGQTVYLAGCATGTATVELRRQSDGTVLNTYTFEVTGSPADLVVESVSVSDSTLTPRAILHAPSHGAQPGHGSVGGDDPALLPLYEPRRFPLRGYASRDRCGGCPRRIPYQCRVDPPDRPLERGHLVLRGLCGQRQRAKAIHATTALLESASRWRPGVRIWSWSVGFGQRKQPDDRAILHAESHGAQPGHGSVGGDHAALVPLDQRDDFDAGYSSRYRPSGRPGRFRTSAESIRLTAPSSEGTYYYGACVAGVSGESDTRNNCSRGVRVTVASAPASQVWKLYWTVELP